MKLRVLRAAQAEIEAATVWYEHRVTGLGVEYVADVDATLSRIEAMPERFPLWHPERPYRKAPLRRFPHLAFYRIVETTIEVVAVAHEKRRPGYWIHR